MNKLLTGAVVMAMLFFMGGIAQAASENITKIVFTTSEQTIDKNAVSAALTIQTQNVSSASEQVSETTTINLSSSGEGTFSSSVTNWEPVTSLTMASSSANRTFYYKGSVPGTHTLTVSDQGQIWTSATQDIVINEVYVATIVGGDSYPTLQAAVTAADEGAVIELNSDITISSQITIEKPLTIDGNGYTILAPFTKTSNSNNSAIGIAGADGAVTINDLTIDGTGSTGSRHGINAYLSSSVVLNNITIVNNNASALNVNGTTLTATDLNTSGNAWGAVNVDPGSGVLLPSVFTLNSGTLAESTQIWSDGANVSGLVTVTVNATGYTMYSVANTPGYIWTNKGVTSGAVIAGVNTIYSTIQAAIDAAADNSVVNVSAGTYDSFSVVDKIGITITGAGKAETIISPSTLLSTGITHKYTADMKASVLVDNSTNVLIEDMSIKSNGDTPGSGGADAIVFWNASTGTMKSCAVTGTYAINGVQSGQGIAVDAGLIEDTSLIVDDCTISGFQKNAIDAVNGNGATSGATGTTTVEIKDSTLTGAGSTSAIAQNGLVLWNRAGGAVTGTITDSTISGFQYAGGGADASGALAYGGGELTTVSESSLYNNDLSISVDALSPGVNAENNWWGSASGAGDTVSETVDADPWYMDSGKTILSDEAEVPDTEGNAVVTVSKPVVVVTDTTQEIKVSVPTGVTQASVSVSALITSGTGSIPKITATSTAVKMEIPASTVTSTNTNWNGVIKLPKVVTPSVAPVADAGTTATVALAIEVGDGDNELTFDEPVKLTFPDQAGKLVGWSRGGTFHTIEDTCDSLTSPTLSAGGECKIDSGADLVVWTKHFTTFTTYTQTAVVSTTTSSGRASRSGGFAPGFSSASAVATVQAGEVLGSMTEAERQARIAEIRTELISLISQLIQRLEAQLAVVQAAQN